MDLISLCTCVAVLKGKLTTVVEDLREKTAELSFHHMKWMDRLYWKSASELVERRLSAVREASLLVEKLKDREGLRVLRRELLGLQRFLVSAACHLERGEEMVAHPFFSDFSEIFGIYGFLVFGGKELKLFAAKFEETLDDLHRSSRRHEISRGFTNEGVRNYVCAADAIRELKISLGFDCSYLARFNIAVELPPVQSHILSLQEDAEQLRLQIRCLSREVFLLQELEGEHDYMSFYSGSRSSKGLRVDRPHREHGYRVRNKRFIRSTFRRRTGQPHPQGFVTASEVA